MAGETTERPRTRHRLLLTVLAALAILLAVIVPVVLVSEGGESSEVLSPQELVDRVGEPGVPGLADRMDPDEQAPLPDEELAAFGEGPPRATSDYRGRPLIVNFWASWCAPCVEEMPDLDGIARQAGERLQVLGVNRDDDAEQAQALAERLGVSYDLALDEDDSLFPAVGGFGMPTTLFVDSSGMVVHRRTGALSADEFAAVLAEHLGVEIAG